LEDFVLKLLRFQPSERRSAASAIQHLFLNPWPDLSRPVSMTMGKIGMGTIAQGDLAPELLQYLQDDPTLAMSSTSKRKRNSSVSKNEDALGLKREFVGYIDANNPPKCRCLNGDADLAPIESKRLANFAKALRRRWKAWLEQLTERVRLAIDRESLPEEHWKDNGNQFMEESFADNAFAYASVQWMRRGERQDGWHTDGGASLLHAALTIFGSRTLQVKLRDAIDGADRIIELPQRPGSFYIGNLCALEHNVVHGAESVGCYKPVGQPEWQIAVMLRTDVFRAARSRSINCTPGPTEVFAIVNRETAMHLAEQPLQLPDLTAVLAASFI